MSDAVPSEVPSEVPSAVPSAVPSVMESAMPNATPNAGDRPAGVPAQLGIVTLGVADLARAEAFYSALGWRRASSSVPGEIIWFQTAHSWLGLFGWDELAEDAGVEADRGGGIGGGGFRGVTLAINVDSAEAVEAAMTVAQRAGATVTRRAEQAPWGGYRGYFADPDGHLWEVAHNPNFPIDEDGRVTIP